MGQQQNRDNRPSSSNVADDHANTLRSVGLIAWSRRPPTDADRIIARLEETVGSDSTVISQRILVQYAVDANSAPAGVETAELGAVRGWQVISADDWLSGQRAALKSLKTDSAMVVDFDRIGRADDLELLARHGQTTAWVQGRDIAPASSWWRRGLRLGVELFSWLTTRGGTRQSLSPALVLPRETWSEVVKEREWMVPPNHELAAVERVAIARQAGDRPLEVPVRLAEPAAPRSIIRTLFASVWSLLLVARIAWRQTWFPAREEQVDPAMGDGPRSEQQDTSPTPTPAWQWAIALLVMLGALPFFLGNLDFPLVEPDETRNVQIALEMHETGDYLLPTRHGSPYLDKPAMLFWSMAKSFEWFGRSEQAARLPIGFAGWLTVVGLIVVGSRRFGLFAATLGGLALMCCVGFAVVSRFVITDVLLTCTMTWAALSLHRGMGTKAWRGVWWTIAGAALGVGILTKGPVAPVLTLPPFLLWCWLERHANRRTLASLLWVVVPMLLVPLPWFLSVALREPAQLEHFFWKHNVVRFTQAFNHQQPFWFYVPVIFAGMFPTSMLLPSMLVGLVSRRESLRRLRTENDGFLWLAGGTTILFFTISSAKLPTYILPSLPMLSLLAGRFVARVIFSPEGRLGQLAQPYHRHLARWLPWQAGAVLAFILVGSAIVEHEVAPVTNFADTMQITAIVGAILGVAIISLLLGGRYTAKWATLGVAAPLILGYVFLDVYPDGATHRSYYPTAMAQLTAWRGENWRHEVGEPTVANSAALVSTNSPGAVGVDPDSIDPADVPLVWFGRLSDSTQLHVDVPPEHQFSEDQVFELCCFAMRQWLRGYPETAIVTIPRHSTLITNRMPIGFELRQLHEGSTIFFLKPQPWWDAEGQAHMAQAEHDGTRHR